MSLRAACWPLLVCGAGASAADAPTFSIEASLGGLFGADEIVALARTLPADREVTFRVRAPAAGTLGVVVFISASDSGALPVELAPVLDEKRLMWIAAEGFGNSRPTAERILAAIMALKLARQRYPIDPRRQYLAGMSGGGRAASQLIGLFPGYFTGAIYIAGADFRMPADPKAKDSVAAVRMAFVTGDRDFNRREMKQHYKRYGDAQVRNTLFVNQPGRGHVMPTPGNLADIIDFLDGS